MYSVKEEEREKKKNQHGHHQGPRQALKAEKTTRRKQRKKAIKTANQPITQSPKGSKQQRKQSTSKQALPSHAYLFLPEKETLTPISKQHAQKNTVE